IHERPRAVCGADGRAAYREGIPEDVSDRIGAEREAADAQHDLIASQARYRSLIENLPAAVYVDTDELRPRTMYISPNAEVVLGYPSERYLEPNDYWIDPAHADDLPAVLEEWALSMQTGETFDL